MSETIPIGSLLIPNEYMVRNSNYTFGIVMGVKDDLGGAKLQGVPLHRDR